MDEQPTQGAVLIVDDDEANTRVLERILKRAGYTRIRRTTDSRHVLSIFKEFEPDILLLDLRMPHLDGFEVLRQIGVRSSEDDFLPVLVITGDLGTETKERALAGGATDFLTKPFDPTEVVLRVRNLLETRALHARLEERVRERTRKLETSEIELAERLAFVAEFRDYFGGAHTRRVGRTSALIAAALGMSQDELDVIRRAAPLHDIGKIAMPDAILLKSGPLTLEEMDKVKAHTTLGAKMLSGSGSRILQVAEEIALYHHENWDGSGYTPGLAGESIPLTGRIVAVADVWDALTHERPYKDAWAHEDATAWITEQKGTKFDPAVVDAFLEVHEAGNLEESDETAAEWEAFLESVRAVTAGG